MPPTPSDEKLVVALEASSPSEAELVRSILEEAGIYALIPNRNNPLPGLDLNPLDPDSGTAGFDVMVRESDLVVAKEAIEEARDAGTVGDSSDEVDDDGEAGLTGDEAAGGELGDES